MKIYDSHDNKSATNKKEKRFLIKERDPSPYIFLALGIVGIIISILGLTGIFNSENKREYWSLLILGIVAIIYAVFKIYQEHRRAKKEKTSFVLPIIRRNQYDSEFIFCGLDPQRMDYKRCQAKGMEPRLDIAYSLSPYLFMELCIEDDVYYISIEMTDEGSECLDETAYEMDYPEEKDSPLDFFIEEDIKETDSFESILEFFKQQIEKYEAETIEFSKKYYKK